MEVDLYFNGLYDYKKGVGGWGTVLVCGDHIKELCGIVENSNQHRACLTALLEGLKALKKEGMQLHIYSFSTAVISPLKNIQKLTKKEENSNSPGNALWKEILEILKSHTVRAEWLSKDSSDNPYCKRSVQLAQIFRRQISHPPKEINIDAYKDILREYKDSHSECTEIGIRKKVPYNTTGLIIEACLQNPLSLDVFDRFRSVAKDLAKLTHEKITLIPKMIGIEAYPEEDE